MQLDLEAMSQFLGNHEMFLVLMQIHIFAILPQLDRVPAIGLLKPGEANIRDVIGFRGKEPLQRFGEPVCEHLDRGGGHLFTALTFESLFQIVLTGERAVLLILLFDHLKHTIIDMARRSQASHEQVGLFLIHVQSVLKCFHVLYPNALENVCQQVRPPAGGRQFTRMLESSGPLAAFLVEPVQTHVVCIDPGVQWSQFWNIWQNAAIRTFLYRMLTPVRWMLKYVSRGASTKRTQ